MNPKTNIAMDLDPTLAGGTRNISRQQVPKYRYQAVEQSRRFNEPTYMYNGEVQNMPTSASDAYSPPVRGNRAEDLSYANLDRIRSGEIGATTRDEQFAAYRRAGRDVFDWEGQQYNTRYAEEAPYVPLNQMQSRGTGVTNIAAPMGDIRQRGILPYSPTTGKIGRRAQRRAGRQERQQERRAGRQERRTEKQQRQQERRDLRNYDDPYAYDKRFPERVGQ